MCGDVAGKGAGERLGFVLNYRAEREERHEIPYIGFLRWTNGRHNGSEANLVHWQLLKCWWDGYHWSGEETYGWSHICSTRKHGYHEDVRYGWWRRRGRRRGDAEDTSG